MSVLVLAGIVLSGAWTQLDEIGWLGWTPLVLAFFFDLFPVRSLRWPRPRLFNLPVDTPATMAAAALCALLLAHLLLTFREEFGFSGDEGYHLSATRAFAVYFLRAAPILFVILALYAVLLWQRFRFAGTAAASLLLAGSLALPQSALFGRYPTAFYLIATPLNVVFDLLRSPYPFSANHVVNTLSLPAWLFVLRPLLIGRWPDWRVMIVAILVYCQPTTLTILGSPLLEPWALIFALLSVEALAALEPDHRWIAVPLCAIAVAFKETFILLLPTTWLLSCVEWRNWRPTLRPGAIGVGIAAVAPFAVYYAVRSTTTARGYDAASNLVGAARLTEWIAAVRAQVGIGSMVSIGLAAVLALRTAPLWIATALAAAAFFLADAVSAPWTGYARFQIYSLVAICAGLFAVMYRRSIGRGTLIAGCAAIALLQLPATVRVLALDLQPDHERNSLEWRRALIRLPIRELSSRMASLDGHALVKRVRVITVGTDLTSLAVAYPDLARRYELVGDQQNEDALDCRCRDDAEAVIAAFEWPANLGDMPTARASFTTVSAACVNQLQTTCVNRSMALDRGGAAVGALGIGRLLLLSSPQDNERPKR